MGLARVYWPCCRLSYHRTGDKPAPSIVLDALSSPDSVIEIKIGDLFDEPEHLVIGANDVFDTERAGEVIQSPAQGQFLTRIYNNDQARLDTDIDAALAPLHQQRTHAPAKIKGKTWRYPVGTALVLGAGDRRYFLSAYGFMAMIYG